MLKIALVKTGSAWITVYRDSDDLYWFLGDMKSRTSPEVVAQGAFPEDCTEYQSEEDAIRDIFKTRFKHNVKFEAIRSQITGQPLQKCSDSQFRYCPVSVEELSSKQLNELANEFLEIVRTSI